MLNGVEIEDLIKRLRRVKSRLEDALDGYDVRYNLEDAVAELEKIIRWLEDKRWT
jgi:exonuclease VII small subunit